METFTVDQVVYALRKEGIPEKLLDTLAGKRRVRLPDLRVSLYSYGMNKIF